MSRKKHNVVVVGAGLFGCIAAALARAEGHRVTIVDNQAPWAASKASGCVLAPSWLNSLTSEQTDTGMRVLRELYTVNELELQTNLLKKFKAFQIHPDHILTGADVVDDVVEVGDGFVRLGAGRPLRGKVLVAAGIYSPELVRMPPMRALWGASLRVPGRLDQPRVKVYAPYRQAVGYNLDRGTVWFGDGTALVTKTWDKERDARIQDTRDRAESVFGLDARHKRTKVFVGARPYVEGHKAGYFEQVFPSTWVSTGGAKNGTVLAAVQADRFLREALS